MQDSSTGNTGAGLHTGWNGRLVGVVAVLAMVNFMVDSAITAPLLVLPAMLDHFETDQAAWLNASAMMAGVLWAPLLAKSADVHGKRKVLVLALLVSGAGAVVCAVAPTMWLFVAGRLLQGAAVAAMFLAVAIVREVFATRTAMVVVGIVTTGSAVLNIGSRFLVEHLAAEFGFQVLFVVAAVVAATMTVCVVLVIPESRVRTPGRIDFAGALLLGGGLAGVLSYISLGSEFGWLAVGPLALLLAGAAALARWFLVSSRKPEPLIDIRNLGLPLVLTLLVLFLAAGSYQSVLQLIPLVADVSASQQLGYGLADQTSLALLFAMPAIGVTLGGPLSGLLAARIGPAATLAGAVLLGLVGILGMFLGVSQPAAALGSALLLGLTVGGLGTAGFNMAGSLAPPERQSVVAGLVMVVIAIGGVVLNFVGAAVLTSSAVIVDGETVNSVSGIFGCIAIAAAGFVAAAVLAGKLVRGSRPVRAESRS
ncbi:MFS transporter [Pseudonocardia sp. MH-G8]|uniref:MFS transporter n=1 Tax=Pseudonocardia sp. MH-G8 TaxID=1854588 RepID=UPI000BA000FF|nr:MFS transporter [Pseudonocardia sp. MH-G8]OZM78883.1 MFS transporter [Pseudonocardia sp. MH-G8]